MTWPSGPQLAISVPSTHLYGSQAGADDDDPGHAANSQFGPVRPTYVSPSGQSFASMVHAMGWEDDEEDCAKRAAADVANTERPMKVAAMEKWEGIIP